MSKNQNQLFEHFGKRDGLQDEYRYGLQYVSNRFQTGSGSDLDDINFDRQSSYVSKTTFGHDQFDSVYGEYETQPYGRTHKQRSSGGFGSGSNRPRLGQNDCYGFNAKLYDDLGNVYNGGMEDVIGDFQVQRDYGRDRYYRDRDREKTYRSRRALDEDYIRDREYRRERRRRRGGRISAEPFMLPQCNSYYPMGPYGPRVQFCPYVPLMRC